MTVNDGNTRVKGSTLKYRDEVDAALIVADVVGYGAENNYRIRWKTAMSNECPWYVREVPTVMASTTSPRTCTTRPWSSASSTPTTRTMK